MILEPQTDQCKTINVSDFNPFIATPAYGGMIASKYVTSLTKLLRYTSFFKGRYHIQFLINESLVTRARNELVAFFMKSECTHLFFIDADIGFSHEDFVRILNLCTEERGVVAGSYPKKGYPVQYVINFMELEGKMVDNLIEVKDAGCGFMCIHRSVISKMMEAYPELKIISDTTTTPMADFGNFMYALFDTMIDEDKRYLSEDYAFCRLWQKIGGHIWLYPFAKLDHVGTVTFEGDVSKIMNFFQDEK